MIIARFVLELRTPIPPNISTDMAEIDQAKWGPWRDQAVAAMEVQAKQAAPKLGCSLRSMTHRLEDRWNHPAGRWLLAEFEMEFLG